MMKRMISPLVEWPSLSVSHGFSLVARHSRFQKMQKMNTSLTSRKEWPRLRKKKLLLSLRDNAWRQSKSRWTWEKRRNKATSMDHLWLTKNSMMKKKQLCCRSSLPTKTCQSREDAACESSAFSAAVSPRTWVHKLISMPSMTRKLSFTSSNLRKNSRKRGRNPKLMEIHLCND